MSLYLDIEKDLGSFRLKVKLEAVDETLALLGASGCGKSLILKCIAGIETPDKGRIVVDDTVLFDSEAKINLSPQQRRTGLMFQSYALFPNMTVLQNINTGANREPDKAKRKAAVEAIMDSFGISELSNRYPHQLSGGQQQRVALARIMVSAPKILLLDEPFSALDSHLRFQLERELRNAIHDFGKTVVLVSHDRDEVFRMSDSIAVMDMGQVHRFGKKAEVFSNPMTRKAAILTGCKNISAIERLGDDTVYATDWNIPLKVKSIPEGANAVGIRMHDIVPGMGENAFRCTVVEEIENPFSYSIMLRVSEHPGDSLIGWEVDKARWHSMRDAEITINLPTEAILLLEN